MLQPYTFTVEHKKGRDNANADALSHLDYTLHYVPKKEGRDVLDGREDGLIVQAGNMSQQQRRAEVIQSSTGLVSTTPLRWQDWIIGGDVSKD